jgi:hypothetical protein
LAWRLRDAGPGCEPFVSDGAMTAQVSPVMVICARPYLRQRVKQSGGLPLI